MKNNHETKSEYFKNLSAGLGVGLALGIVFGSALNGLLPFPFDILVGIITGLLIGYHIGTHPPMLMRYPAFIVRRILVTGVLFVLGTFGYVSLLDLSLTVAQRIWSSLLAIVPTILFVLAIATAIAQLDEMQRRIQVEAIAIAFAGTAIVVAVYTLLGIAGVPSPNWGLLIVIMTFMWGIGKLWTMWRYK
jgi:fumarate reductase subunit D